MHAHGKELEHQDVQKILQAYLLAHPESAAVPTVAVPNLFELRPNSSVAEIQKQLESVSRSIPRDAVYRRLVINIPLQGHFGFAVVDRETGEVVIGEPLGKESYDKELQKYIDAFNQIPGLKIFRFNRCLQKDKKDNFNCGRISAKVLAYLATTKESLTEAIKNEEAIKALTVHNDAESQDLHREQSNLLKTSILMKHPKALPDLYKNFLTNSIKLSQDELASLDENFYQEMHDGFTTACRLPFLLAKPEEACKRADPQTLKMFREIIQTYIAVKNAKPDQQNALFANFWGQVAEAELINMQINDKELEKLGYVEKVDYVFKYACNGAIRCLSSNSSKAYLKTLKTPQPCNKTSTQKQPATSSPTNASIKANDPWEKISNTKFIDLIDRYKGRFDVKRSVDGKEVILSKLVNPGEVPTEAKLRRNKDNQVEVEAKNPDPDTMNIMADSLSQGLQPGSSVTIDVTGSNMNDPKVQEKARQMLNQLWLAAMQSGLQVTNYTPKNTTIRQKGSEAYEKFMNKNANTPALSI
jgi:hypothetical protein